jgi:predicted alpha/beta hydrolase family esterase
MALADHPLPPQQRAGDVREPLVLTVPGLNNSGPTHWQTLWEQQRGDCRRAELGMWDKPHRNTWVNKLNLAIRHADRRVVLVAHSLGCIAVAWWAHFEGREAASRVAGALLVAPPEVDFFPLDPRLETFAPTPSHELPFPSILVGSRNDPYMGFRTAQRLAKVWGSRFADAGTSGHINADSQLGDWQFGQFLLGQLLKRPSSLRQDASGDGAATGGASRYAHGREALPVETPATSGSERHDHH